MTNNQQYRAQHTSMNKPRYYDASEDKIVYMLF